MLYEYTEMGIYRDNLSAIIYYRLSLSLKIVWIYRLPTVAYAGFCNGEILATSHRDDVSFSDVTAIIMP